MRAVALTASFGIVATALGGFPPPAAGGDPVGPSAVDGGTGKIWRDLALPTPLAPNEEADPSGALIARRFNPAMAINHGDIWPVAVDYAWRDGSPLVGRVRGDDGRVLREFVALTPQQLAKNEFGELPGVGDDGRRIDYHVDAPGDDRLQDGISLWRKRWREIQHETAKPSIALPQRPYPPTQYAHLFWFNRERGLLAIQYWFYYPYNEWINHHEGDWEHVNVILHGPSRLSAAAAYRVVGYEFFFHEFSYEPKRVVRVAGKDSAEDHVMVYVGGTSQFLGWTGSQSGGSYPLPALFPHVGGGFANLRAPDDVRRSARFIRPEDFKVVMLPEPDRLDVGVHPELAWLRLSFFAGQTHMHENPLALNGMVFGTAPRQPARQETWNAELCPPAWTDRPEINEHIAAMPRDFKPLLTPLGEPGKVFLSARKPGARPRPGHNLSGVVPGVPGKNRTSLPAQ